MPPVAEESQSPRPTRPKVNRIPRQRRSEEERLEEGRMPQLLEHEEMSAKCVPGSASSSEEESVPSSYVFPSSFDGSDPVLTYTPTSTNYTPSNAMSSGLSSWSAYSQRPRGGSGGAGTNGAEQPFEGESQLAVPEVRPSRPGAPLR